MRHPLSRWDWLFCCCLESNHKQQSWRLLVSANTPTQVCVSNILLNECSQTTTTGVLYMMWRSGYIFLIRRYPVLWWKHHDWWATMQYSRVTKFNYSFYIICVIMQLCLYSTLLSTYTQADWKFAAMVLDRICLILFSLFTFIATVTTLAVAPHVLVW